MRYSIAAIALGVALMVFAESGIVPSNDTIMLSVAIVIAGALAGGGE